MTAPLLTVRGQVPELMATGRQTDSRKRLAVRGEQVDYTSFRPQPYLTRKHRLQIYIARNTTPPKPLARNRRGETAPTGIENQIPRVGKGANQRFNLFEGLLPRMPLLFFGREARNVRPAARYLHSPLEKIRIGFQLLTT